MAEGVGLISPTPPPIARYLEQPERSDLQVVKRSTAVRSFSAAEQNMTSTREPMPRVVERTVKLPASLGAGGGVGVTSATKSPCKPYALILRAGVRFQTVLEQAIFAAFLKRFGVELPRARQIFRLFRQTSMVKAEKNAVCWLGVLLGDKMVYNI